MILGAIIMIVVVVIFFVGRQQLENKNELLEKQIEILEQQKASELERTNQLDERAKYVQTKRYIEEVAKNKFGLIYPDEIVIKPRS